MTLDMHTVSVSELRKRHPFPWQGRQFTNGLFQVIDSAGAEVPIPSLVSFVATVTAKMHAQAQAGGKQDA